MMRRIAFLFVAFVGACFTQTFAQYGVRPADKDTQALAPCLFYCLPQNTLKVEVVVEKTFLERGIYSDYADQLLKLPAVKENKTYYAIREIRVHSGSIADPAQTYLVEGPEFPALRLSPEGILLGVNLPPENIGEAPERHSRPFAEQTESRRVKPLTPKDEFVPVADLNANKRFDTVVSMHRTDTAMVIEKILKPRIDEKTLFEQARKMADQILKIQKTQSDLLSGLQEVPYPEGTMKFMYQQLERNERRFLDCFTGTVSEERLRYEFEIIPVEGKTRYVVADFTPDAGIVRITADTDSEIGDDAIVLNLEKLPSMEQAENRTEESLHGFAYRVPAKVNAEVRYHNEILSRRDVLIAQWGFVRQLPALNGYILKFHPETGALQHIEKPATPVEPSHGNNAPKTKKR